MVKVHLLNQVCFVHSNVSVVCGVLIENVHTVSLAGVFLSPCSGAAIALVLTNYGRSLFIIVYVWTSKIYVPTWTGTCIYLPIEVGL